MCGRSPELFLGSKKKKRKEKESLGDVRKDRFKAFGGGVAAKKGQGKEKAPMFTEKKKVSGKSDGEVKPIRGMALCGPLGRAGRPHRPRGGESHSVSHPATLHPAAQAPAQPSKGPLRSARSRLCPGIALIHCLPARMEFTFLLADLRCLHPAHPTPGPASEAQEGLAGWGRELPAALLFAVLTKGPGLSQAPQV